MTMPGANVAPARHRGVFDSRDAPWDNRRWQRTHPDVREYREDAETHCSSSYAYHAMEMPFRGEVRTVIPVALNDIEEAIAKSRYILEQYKSSDADTEGEYAVETWERATNLVRVHIRRIREVFQEEIAAPKIVAGADGSVDIRWKADRRSLVISIPPAGDGHASFYGKDSRPSVPRIINGDVDEDDADWLFLWIAE